MMLFFITVSTLFIVDRTISQTSTTYPPRCPGCTVGSDPTTGCTRCEPDGNSNTGSECGTCVDDPPSPPPVTSPVTCADGQCVLQDAYSCQTGQTCEPIHGSTDIDCGTCQDPTQPPSICDNQDMICDDMYNTCVAGLECVERTFTDAFSGMTETCHVCVCEHCNSASDNPDLTVDCEDSTKTCGEPHIQLDGLECGTCIDPPSPPPVTSPVQCPSPQCVLNAAQDSCYGDQKCKEDSDISSTECGTCQDVADPGNSGTTDTPTDTTDSGNSGTTGGGSNSDTTQPATTKDTSTDTTDSGNSGTTRDGSSVTTGGGSNSDTTQPATTKRDTGTTRDTGTGTTGGGSNSDTTPPATTRDSTTGGASNSDTTQPATTRDTGTGNSDTTQPANTKDATTTRDTSTDTTDSGNSGATTRDSSSATTTKPDTGTGTTRDSSTVTTRDTSSGTTRDDSTVTTRSGGGSDTTAPATTNIVTRLTGTTEYVVPVVDLCADVDGLCEQGSADSCSEVGMTCTGSVTLPDTDTTCPVCACAASECMDDDGCDEGYACELAANTQSKCGVCNPITAEPASAPKIAYAEITHGIACDASNPTATCAADQHCVPQYNDGSGAICCDTVDCSAEDATTCDAYTLPFCYGRHDCQVTSKNVAATFMAYCKVCVAADESDLSSESCFCEEMKTDVQGQSLSDLAQNYKIANRIVDKIVEKCWETCPGPEWVVVEDPDRCDCCALTCDGQIPDACFHPPGGSEAHANDIGVAVLVGLICYVYNYMA